MNIIDEVNKAVYDYDNEIISWKNIKYNLKNKIYDKLYTKVKDINKIFQLIMRYNIIGLYDTNEQLAVPSM